MLQLTRRFENYETAEKFIKALFKSDKGIDNFKDVEIVKEGKGAKVIIKYAHTD